MDETIRKFAYAVPICMMMEKVYLTTGGMSNDAGYRCRCCISNVSVNHVAAQLHKLTGVNKLSRFREHALYTKTDKWL